METREKVDNYINRHADKSAILEKLRALLLASELQETVKWGIPVYTLEGKNVVGMAAFKDYAGLWFYQGALLADEHHVLINAQEGKTQALRQWRFISVNELEPDIINEYVREAIAHQKAGIQVKMSKPKAVALPQIMKNALEEDKVLDRAFHDLSPAKRREYAAYISQAKREDTKLKRWEKISAMIRESKGLNDRYKKT
ncbi:DUF1801 domain-containing protein [Catalinimonas sp. 4WD22]|uniref:YdeI/OmpD-associated family protein n=1 Tax=Catalinimonas locisalis TaxID=3133978 RepID=UPI0031015D63